MGLLKILVPLGLIGGVGGAALLLSSKSAKAAPGGPVPTPTPRPSTPGEPAINPQLRSIMDAAIKTGDPVVIRKVAEQADAAGFPEQARSLREVADQIEKAMRGVKPVTPGRPAPDPVKPVPPAPAPSPVIPPFVPPSPSFVGPSPAAPTPAVIPPTPIIVPRKQARVLYVKKGEGWFQIAQRAGQGSQAKMKELRDRNIPIDAGGVRREAANFNDPKYRGSKPGLQPGDRLFVPESWPDDPDMKLEEVAIVSGDEDSVSGNELKRLAGRVATEVMGKNKGSENRELIQTFQTVGRSDGCYEGEVNGLYNAHTMAALAKCSGIVPPLSFADGKPPYYPTNPAPARRALRELFSELAERDQSRHEEWAQAARNV